MDTNKLLADFERLLSASDSQSTVEPFLRLLGQKKADILRHSAIPHEITPYLLCVLFPSMQDNEAEQLCEIFASYSFIIPEGEVLSFHDQTRRELFNWWLNRDDKKEFEQSSARLAEHFSHELEIQTEANGEAYETLLRKRMYHLLGANQAEGFQEFIRLSGRARYQRRFNECTTLARLVHDYDPVLSIEHKTWLAYNQGKVAGDLNQVERAEELLQSVLTETEGPQLSKAAAFMRLGNLRHRAWKLVDAKQLYEQSLELAESTNEGAPIIPRIKHDLGAVCRDAQEYEFAYAYFRSAIDLAESLGDRYIHATILNSLGRLYINLRQIDKAIETFKEGLRLLESLGEQFELAQVYSNLGNAYMEKGNYQESSSLYERSLTLSREAGNTMAQAEALNNLAQVFRAQNQLEDAASKLIHAANLFREVGSQFRAGVALQNCARCYRSLGKIDMAEERFREAEKLFRHKHAKEKVAEIQLELQSIHAREKMPWWVWGCIVIVGVFIVAILGILLFELFQ